MKSIVIFYLKSSADNWLIGSLTCNAWLQQWLTRLTFYPQEDFNNILDKVIFVLVLVVIDDWGISCETVLSWMSLDFSENKSILV